jgi:hypothetical protein
MKTLERRLVNTLQEEAERLPDEQAAHTLSPGAPMRPGFLRPGLAAPAAVMAVLILAAPLIWLSTQRGGGPATDTSQPVATTVPANPPAFDALLGSIIGQLPDSFNPELARPVFAMDAGAEETALTYLETRHLPDDVGVSRIEQQDGYTLVRWTWGQGLGETQTEQGQIGWLLMTPTRRGFEILASTTDSIDLSGLSLTAGTLRGEVRSSTDEYIGVDVLNLDETPVASAPNPEGMPDADFLWGTAGSGTTPLTVDMPVSEPVVVRVNRVGGTMVSVSEVVFGQPDVDDEVPAPDVFPHLILDLPDTELVDAYDIVDDTTGERIGTQQVYYMTLTNDPDGWLGREILLRIQEPGTKFPEFDQYAPLADSTETVEINGRVVTVHVVPDAAIEEGSYDLGILQWNESPDYEVVVIPWGMNGDEAISLMDGLIAIDESQRKELVGGIDVPTTTTTSVEPVTAPTTTGDGGR